MDKQETGDSVIRDPASWQSRFRIPNFAFFIIRTAARIPSSLFRITKADGSWRRRKEKKKDSADAPLLLRRAFGYFDGSFFELRSQNYCAVSLAHREQYISKVPKSQVFCRPHHRLVAQGQPFSSNIRPQRKGLLFS